MRENPSIEDSASKHYFHYFPTDIDITSDFKKLGLLKKWGKSEEFHKDVSKEISNYLSDQNYDPIAICFGIRTKIESYLYNLIIDQDKKDKFLEENGTKNKMELCERYSINVPDIFFLLGLIYNTTLHWNQNYDLVAPLSMKLDHLIIKKLIQDLFNNF